MKAAIYTRYSSHEQDGGESIEFQIAQCKEYIQNMGWTLNEDCIFTDRAKSGTTTRGRDAFAKLVNLVTKGHAPFDVLVVWSTSRFGRNMEEVAVNKAALRRNGVEIRFVSQVIPEGQGIEGHMGKIVESLYEWTDELQSIQIGLAAFEGQRSVTSKGFHGGGKAPFGYRRIKVIDPDGKKDKDGEIIRYVTFVPNEDEELQIRRIFNFYAQGMSYKQIASKLNEEGVVSPGGSTWDISSVRTILINEVYLGIRVWNKTRRNKRLKKGTKTPKPREEWIITENAHPALIDKELWEKVQDRRKRMSPNPVTGKGSPWTNQSPHLLTGVIRCAECGANYHMNTIRSRGKKRQYYRCGFHSKRGNAVCKNGRGVNKENVENAVLELLSKRLFDDRIVDEVFKRVQAYLQRSDEGDETLAIESAIMKNETEIANLTAGIKAGGNLESLIKELAVGESRRKVLKQKHEAMRSAKSAESISRDLVRRALEELRGTLTYAGAEEKKGLIQDHVHEIRVSPDGTTLLETNPRGLLNTLGVCEFLVTPRGVEPPLPD